MTTKVQYFEFHGLSPNLSYRGCKIVFLTVCKFGEEEACPLFILYFPTVKFTE